MRKTFGIVAAFALVVMLDAPGSNAQEFRHYPWCLFTGGSESSIELCGFDSFEQCLLTRSGGGGICFSNPAYPGAVEPLRQRSRRGVPHARGRM
jgi:hypothetical protein